jgi:hypothetical protein
VDNELKAYLEGMEARFAERFDAVDSRIAAVDARIDAVESRIMERVDGRIDAVEERLKDFIRKSDHDLETKMIAEFWRWGRTSDMRTRQALADASALNERMLAVEDRVSALERRSA